jgi:hypothetical protein
LTKFCVIATVSSRFKTACHHYDGTNIVSPTPYTASTIGTPAIKSYPSPLSLIYGSTSPKYSIASNSSKSALKSYPVTFL